MNSPSTPSVPHGHRVLFLPGAAGEGIYWGPVADRLSLRCERVLLDWPGLGKVPSSPRIVGLEGLVGLVLNQMDRPVDLVAQSMGGVIAVRAALARPAMVRRLVLCATSGGVDMSKFRAVDWRSSYREAYPSADPWVLEYRRDLSKDVRSIGAPTLLLWGDADPISPVTVGEYWAGLLPRARLIVISGGTHTFATDKAEEVAVFITKHLAYDGAGD